MKILLFIVLFLDATSGEPLAGVKTNLGYSDLNGVAISLTTKIKAELISYEPYQGGYIPVVYMKRVSQADLK